MLPVEIVPFNESVVLRARGSELLILPHHVRELKGKKSPQDFTSYFTGEALINRPARKLFEAWLRKDNTLWPRLYKTVHEEIQLDKEEDSPKVKVEAKAGGATKIVNPPKQNIIVKSAAKSDTVEKPGAKKTEAKAAPKPAKVEPKKPEAKKPEPKKAEAKPAPKKVETKPAPKKAEAKPAAKATPSKKPAAKAAPAKPAPAKKPAAKAAPAKKPAAKAAPAKKGKGK